MTSTHLTQPDTAADALNRAAGILSGIGDADFPFLIPAIPLRCMLAASLLCRAGAEPDEISPPTRHDTLVRNLRDAMILIGRLPADLFDTDTVLDAVAAMMLAYEATG